MYIRGLHAVYIALMHLRNPRRIDASLILIFILSLISQVVIVQYVDLTN